MGMKFIIEWAKLAIGALRIWDCMDYIDKINLFSNPNLLTENNFHRKQFRNVYGS